jgi:hypothetical protein
MTIKANWSAYSVRKVCIKNDFCTSMTCDEYGHMLDWVSSHEPTAEAVATVAHVIEQGTGTPEGIARDEFYECITFALLNSAITYRLEA